MQLVKVMKMNSENSEYMKSLKSFWKQGIKFIVNNNYTQTAELYEYGKSLGMQLHESNSDKKSAYWQCFIMQYIQIFLHLFEALITRFMEIEIMIELRSGK